MAKGKTTDLVAADVDLPPVQGDLRKAVEAIAITPLGGRITLATRKLSNLLLKHAQKDGPDCDGYRLPLSSICATENYDSTNTPFVKDALRKMGQTIVEWNTGVKGSRRWGVSPMIMVEIIEEGNRCFIEWDYPKKVKGRLLDPSVYAKITFDMQDTIRSNAAFALCEIALRYQDSPGGLTMRLPWEQWRPILTGTPDGDDEDNKAYREYKYFKRDVLKPAVIEVTSLTDMKVTLVEHKAGRSVKDVQFKVEPKLQGALQFDEPNLFDLSLVSRIEAFGIDRKKAEKIYSSRDEGPIRAAIEWTEARLARKDLAPVRSAAALFHDALAKGYGKQGKEPPGLTEGKKHKALPNKGEPPPATSISALTARLATEWMNEQRKIIRASFDDKDHDAQAILLADFESQELPKHGHLAKRWKSSGLTDKMCATKFIAWLSRDIAVPPDMELMKFGLERGLISST